MCHFYIFREYKCTGIDSIATIQIERQVKRSGPSRALSALACLLELFLVFCFQDISANASKHVCIPITIFTFVYLD